MRTFKDTEGREWQIAVNVNTVKRVRASLDIDLLAIEDGKLLERLHRDPVLLCDVLFVVCKPQVEQRSLTDEDFGAALAGDAIEHATVALLEDLVDFSPSPKDRANLKKVLDATWAVMDRARDQVAAVIDDKLEEVKRQTLGEISTSLQASQESTRDP